MAGVGEDDLTLSVCGAPLEDSCLVSELSCAELDLTIPLLGGKVHGSLARAGECIHSPYAIPSMEDSLRSRYVWRSFWVESSKSK